MTAAALLSALLLALVPEGSGRRTVRLGCGMLLAVVALLAIVLTTPVFLALVLALLAALYALTQRWLSTRGVRRFESIR